MKQAHDNRTLCDVLYKRAGVGIQIPLFTGDFLSKVAVPSSISVRNRLKMAIGWIDITHVKCLGA